MASTIWSKSVGEVSLLLLVSLEEKEMILNWWDHHMLGSVPINMPRTKIGSVSISMGQREYYV